MKACTHLSSVSQLFHIFDHRVEPDPLCWLPCACQFMLTFFIAVHCLPRTSAPPPPTAKACKVEADKLCNVSWFFGYKSGQVISCLRDTKAQVSKSCKKQVFKVMLDVSVWQGPRELGSACVTTERASASDTCVECVIKPSPCCSTGNAHNLCPDSGHAAFLLGLFSSACSMVSCHTSGECRC